MSARDGTCNSSSAIDFIGQLNKTVITKGFIFKTKSCRIQRQFFLCVSPVLRNTLGLKVMSSRGCLVKIILSGPYQ